MIQNINKKDIEKYINRLEVSKKKYVEFERFNSKKNNFKFLILVFNKNIIKKIKIIKNTTIYCITKNFKVKANNIIYDISKDNIGIRFNKNTEIEIHTLKNISVVIKIYEKKSKFN